MLDLVALAGTAVTTILLPYIKDGAKKFAETIAENQGQGMAEYAAEFAGSVWDKVKSIFSSDEEKILLKQFEEEPEAAEPLIKSKLKKKLEQSPQLAEEMDKLINSPTPDGQSTGAQIIGSSYVGFLDMRNANVSGSNNTFTGGSFNFGPETEASAIRPPSPKPTPQPTTKRDNSN
jgi:hypothetical protein